MPEELVTIAAFDESTRAHLAVARLEAQGIDAFLADENVGAMFWHYNCATGGIKLQVRNCDADRAAELLDRRHNYPDAPTEADVAEPRLRCPACNSGAICRDHSFRNWLIVAVPLCAIVCGFVLKALSLAIPLILWFVITAGRHRKGWRCNRCGHIWRHLSAIPPETSGRKDRDGQ